ncbi:RNA polymerase II associated factor Paf1 [Artemisia annua]|uniref:RNA polymerase II associated factor Paf1 n=1 Tax=Artemisia annua TaxID=35608 RepID=A0A2U1MNQ8_ARTAN|nr:RNA polymerase II associated factor Paf1 [Artemisia annua]
MDLITSILRVSCYWSTCASLDSSDSFLTPSRSPMIGPSNIPTIFDQSRKWREHGVVAHPSLPDSDSKLNWPRLFGTAWYIGHYSDMDNDLEMERHVVHQNRESPALGFAPLEASVLRAYISAARKLSLSVPRELEEYIATAYSSIRQEEAKSNTQPQTQHFKDISCTYEAEEDSVLVTPPDESHLEMKPSVAIIKDIYETLDGSINMTGQKFYRHGVSSQLILVMHKCCVHYLEPDKNIPSPKQHPGFIVRKVYDSISNKLNELLDSGFAEVVKWTVGQVGWNDQFVVATCDGAPTVDSESYNKMDKSVRDAHESQAIMKSFVASTSGSDKPDKFLAYMVPSVGELSKDTYDEDENISYTWVREYHCDVRGEDADDPTNFLVAFGESEARYMRARDGKSSDEVEHFHVPASVTVRQRSRVSVDMKESESYIGSKRSRHHEQMEMEDSYHEQQKDMQDDGDMD